MYSDKCLCNNHVCFVVTMIIILCTSLENAGHVFQGVVQEKDYLLTRCSPFILFVILFLAANKLT